MKIIIELIENSKDDNIWDGWKVTVGNKYADALGYDEMLGLVAAVSMPDKRPTLQWLKTKEEHLAAKTKYTTQITDFEA